MNFDISKLDLPKKDREAKARPRFGPSARVKPRPQAKPVQPAQAPAEPPSETPADHPSAGAVPSDTLLPQQPSGGTLQQPNATSAQPASEANNLDSATASGRDGQGAAAGEPSQPHQEMRSKPAAGKRKAPEPAAVPETNQPPSSHLPANQAPKGQAAAGDENALALIPSEDQPAEDTEAGPMTKAKRRKGLGKGTHARKPKAPLAEQKIDPVSMPLKTIIKVACAKDKVKTAAAKAAKSAAAALSNSHEPTPRHTPDPEPSTSGVAQMIVDPETGQLIIDPASLTMQAQAPMQYFRREDNDDVLINSMSHMRREANARWTPEETEEFYAALGIFGTNFQAVADRLALRMAQQGLLAVKRSRKQVKMKFNKEEKLHPRRIDATLRGQGAMPEDYIEITHDVKASRNEVQDSETAYLEAPPAEGVPAEDSLQQSDANQQTQQGHGQQVQPGAGKSAAGIPKAKPGTKPSDLGGKAAGRAPIGGAVQQAAKDAANNHSMAQLMQGDGQPEDDVVYY